jgi:hypothetical protein
MAPKVCGVAEVGREEQVLVAPLDPGLEELRALLVDVLGEVHAGGVFVIQRGGRAAHPVDDQAGHAARVANGQFGGNPRPRMGAEHVDMIVVRP